MFDYLKGTLVHKQGENSGNITVEVGSVGYLIEVTSRDFLACSKTGSEIKVYTVLLHREDSMSLCGFLQREDRDIFRILTSVSGVGAKMALMLLSEFDAIELISLVIKGDYKELTRAKGVGIKLAQKIIIELKDKLVNFQSTMPIEIPSSAEIRDEQALQDTQAVLVSLGYEREEIKSAVLKALPFVKQPQNAEEILKETLKILSL